MFSVAKLRRRIVIDVNTAERIGYVTDMEIDEVSGRISAIIIRKNAGIFSGFFRIGEMSLPWQTIQAMGDEYVLVKSFDFIGDVKKA